MMNSEKKRSPLSFGNVSALGNGGAQPTSTAILFKYWSSEWFQYGTILSQAAGMRRRSSTEGLPDVRWALLCRIARFHLAVPARFKLSASDGLIPLLAKWANRSWNFSNLDSPLLEIYSVSPWAAFGFGGILSYMSSMGIGSDKYCAFSLQFLTAPFVSGVKRGMP